MHDPPKLLEGEPLVGDQLAGDQLDRAQLEHAREQLLVLSARLGDRRAFHALVDRYERRLLYFLRRLLSDADSLDVLQEVWLTVFRRLHTLSAPAAFRVWLYRIARDKAVDRLRRQRRDQQALRQLAEETVEEPAADGPELALEDAEVIHRALAELSVPQREVMTLRFLESMSIEEIAAVVGCPAGTVKSRMHHALRQMRKLVESIHHV